MLNIAYTHVSVILVIFYYYMLQNKQSNSRSLYSMTSVVVFCISYKVEYLDKKRSNKNSTKEVILLFYLIFPTQPSKCWTKFRFINTLMLMV